MMYGKRDIVQLHLSAAMGMAAARDIKGDSNYVIPVIGDGALTGGMALEALNHIGHDENEYDCHFK